MKLHADDLIASPDFNKVFEIRHEDIFWFITRNIRPVNFSMILFYGLNLLFISLLGLNLIRDIAGNHSIWEILKYFIGGVMMFIIILIPLHEGIHLLAFKMLGAKSVKVSAQWDKLLFYAAADKFVMNYKEFLFLALLPFILLNALILLGLNKIHSPLEYSLWSLLLLHSFGCIGDFSLIGFLSKKDNRDLLSYDDFHTMTTYFFAPAKKKPKIYYSNGFF